jgi:FeS assembly SUF system protein
MSREPSLADFLTGGAKKAEGEPAMARAGEPLEAGEAPASEEAIIDAMKTVYDPEIPVNIYDLGLIYKLDVAGNGNVAVDMTLTAPACPVAGEMPGRVAEAVAAVPGVGEVEVRLVWEPPWTKDRMSEDAKLALDIY